MFAVTRNPDSLEWHISPMGYRYFQRFPPSLVASQHVWTTAYLDFPSQGILWSCYSLSTVKEEAKGRGAHCCRN